MSALAFGAPWVLIALAALPVLWWLIRITPPVPRRVAFPPLRLLRDLLQTEQTPARTPLWLILLRALIAALVIAGLADPVLREAALPRGSGPLLLVVDDGWASARHWPIRQRTMLDLIAEAEQEGRNVVLVTTAPRAETKAGGPLQPMRPDQAAEAVRALQPKPWPVDRSALVAALDTGTIAAPAISVWIGDGLDDDALGPALERLQRLGPVRVMADREGQGARILMPPENEGAQLRVTLTRLVRGAPETTYLRGIDTSDTMILREALPFAADATEARRFLNLPSELRNRLARFEIEGEATAAGVALVDERWRRRPVGLVSGGQGQADQPLLGDLYYLERALQPFAEVRRGSLADVLAARMAVVVLSDLTGLTPVEIQELEGWVRAGGIVMRFAGPALAENPDSLLPVKLRGAVRSLGGAMTWSQPMPIAPFPPESPFAGLAVPEEATVTRQVLAEPTPELNARSWARLADGTPLVTAEKRGEGWIVLVHITANTAWSDLPLSGLFVEMLRRVVGLSRGVGGPSRQTLPPVETMNGFGHLGPPPPTAAPIPAGTVAEVMPSPLHPPGFYGTDTAREALNLSAGLIGPNRPALRPVERLPAGVEQAVFNESGTVRIKPWLLTAALLLVLADLVISLAMRGLLPRRVGRTPGTGPGRRRARPAATALFALATGLAALAPGASIAQLMPIPETRPPETRPPETRGGAVETRRLGEVPEAALETRFAYVLTGDRRVDGVSRAGLRGLGMVLAQRTAIEPGDPVGVDLESDDIAVYPILFWPVTEAQPAPSPQAASKINAFLRHGGMIVFDQLGEAGAAGALSRTRASALMRKLAGNLALPPLTRLPADHVITRSFYLIQETPGRFAGGPVWVEFRGGRENDGVSPVVIGSADWAAAWALDDGGQPLFPTVPGGEIQREAAFRFGVNLVMYALAGNYKADQVHVPTILQRLGI